MIDVEVQDEERPGCRREVRGGVCNIEMGLQEIR
jgi:hypothetical protein